MRPKVEVALVKVANDGSNKNKRNAKTDTKGEGSALIPSETEPTDTNQEWNDTGKEDPP